MELEAGLKFYYAQLRALSVLTTKQPVRVYRNVFPAGIRHHPVASTPEQDLRSRFGNDKFSELLPVGTQVVWRYTTPPTTVVGTQTEPMVGAQVLDHVPHDHKITITVVNRKHPHHPVTAKRTVGKDWWQVFGPGLDWVYLPLHAFVATGKPDPIKVLCGGKASRTGDHPSHATPDLPGNICRYYPRNSGPLASEVGACGHWEWVADHDPAHENRHAHDVACSKLVKRATDPKPPRKRS